jgi:hypothetical protein
VRDESNVNITDVDSRSEQNDESPRKQVDSRNSDEQINKTNNSCDNSDNTLEEDIQTFSDQEDIQPSDEISPNQDEFFKL